MSSGSSESSGGPADKYVHTATGRGRTHRGRRGAAAEPEEGEILPAPADLHQGKKLNRQERRLGEAQIEMDLTKKAAELAITKPQEANPLKRFLKTMPPHPQFNKNLCHKAWHSGAASVRLSPSSSPEKLGRQLAACLEEPKTDLITRVVKTLGTALAIKLYNQAQNIARRQRKRDESYDACLKTTKQQMEARKKLLEKQQKHEVEQEEDVLMEEGEVEQDPEEEAEVGDRLAEDGGLEDVLGEEPTVEFLDD